MSEPILQIMALLGLPEIQQGENLAAVLVDAAHAQDIAFRDKDVIVIAQKIVSKAEGRIVPLESVQPSARAHEIAAICEKDPRLVELILSESKAIVRCQRNILIVEHLRGFIVANAGVDQSNVPERNAALLSPIDPDASAQELQKALADRCGKVIAVVINDSFGRP